MPLILQGARQIGKTYAVNYFAGVEYENCVYCNFEKEINLHSVFTDLSPSVIIPKIASIKRCAVVPEKTLIIFDEVQACLQALSSLKYFCEEAGEYHIIALGSLLGVAVNRGEKSFPVGKVQFLNMYPMDFEEFLLACSENYLLEQIRNCFKTFTPLEDAFHQKALTLYKEYLFTGGMPRVVEDYVKNHNGQFASLCVNIVVA